ncbi:MAG: STAS domain-containing protein [Clostridiales Family XIII bacterium]|jgi:anti-anti-sigma factor|nr:STAS domain-containing protein [Clostridiales Family XIII bacterium]
MTISEHTNDAGIVLEVDGRVDANTSDQLQAAVLSALKTAKHVTVDFSKVSYLSSGGLRALLLGHKQALLKGAAMELANPSDFVKSVLVSVGFDKMLRVTYDKQDRA